MPGAGEEILASREDFRGYRGSVSEGEAESAMAIAFPELYRSLHFRLALADASGSA
jgi:hypothetical protein